MRCAFLLSIFSNKKHPCTPCSTTLPNTPLSCHCIDNWFSAHVILHLEAVQCQLLQIERKRVSQVALRSFEIRSQLGVRERVTPFLPITNRLILLTESRYLCRNNEVYQLHFCIPFFILFSFSHFLRKFFYTGILRPGRRTSPLASISVNHSFY